MTFGWRNMVAIEGDIVYRYSVAGLPNRHSQGSTGRIRQLFNASWRQTREHVSLATDDGAYQFRGATTTLPTVPAVTGEAYAEVPFPVDAVAVCGVRCIVNGTRWYPLKRIPFAAIHDFQPDGYFSGYVPNRGPIAYCPRSIPEGIGQLEAAGTIMITPVPTSGSYSVWYLQQWQDRTNDADTFSGVADHIEHAILGTLLKMAQPDMDSNKQVKLWILERQRIEDQLTARAARIAETMPLEPRDSRNDGYDDAYWRGPL